MPTYEYACSTCDDTHEVQQKMSDPTLTECPVCGEPGLRKLFSGVGIHFKGSGFYRTDSRDGKSTGGATKSSDKGGASSTGGDAGSSSSGSSSSGSSSGASSSGSSGSSSSTSTAGSSSSSSTTSSASKAPASTSS